MKVDDLISFDKMLTPVIIKILFVIGASLAIVFGIYTIVQGGTGNFIGGLLMLLLGPIAVRIYAELLIIMFQIHADLMVIRDELKK